MREHVHPTQIAGYIDRTLDQSTRAEFEAHLADCAVCRAELVGAHRTLRGKPLHRRPWVVGPLAAAAAVVALMILPRGEVIDSQQPILRAGPESVGIQRVTAVQPAAGASIAEDDRTFVWQAVAEDANYRMTVTQIDGSRVWSLETADTVATVPDSVGLTAGNIYLWVVDAMLADGSQAKTEVRSFTIAP